MTAEHVEFGPVAPRSGRARRLRTLTTAAVPALCGFLAYPVVLNASLDTPPSAPPVPAVTVTVEPGADATRYGLHPGKQRWCQVTFAPGLITGTRCFHSKAAYVRWLEAAGQR